MGCAGGSTRFGVRPRPASRRCQTVPRVGPSAKGASDWVGRVPRATPGPGRAAHDHQLLARAGSIVWVNARSGGLPLLRPGSPQDQSTQPISQHPSMYLVSSPTSAPLARNYTSVASGRGLGSPASSAQHQDPKCVGLGPRASATPSDRLPGVRRPFSSASRPRRSPVPGVQGRRSAAGVECPPMQAPRFHARILAAAMGRARNSDQALAAVHSLASAASPRPVTACQPAAGHSRSSDEASH